MSVKHAMLALLSAQPASTYQLRKRFDTSTAQSWPINIGQVSTTLQRLERDGLVARDDEPGQESPDGGEGSGRPWQLTQAGETELADWWVSPVIADQRGRDELVVKIALAAVTPGVEVPKLLQLQREATQRAMHDLTKLRMPLGNDELVARLVLDHHLFVTEAELRWLDEVEAALPLVEATKTSAATQHQVDGATGRDRQQAGAQS
jgi:DNA-binding PadR family transcriptional regulator